MPSFFPFAQMEQSDWPSKSLRVWLSLEVSEPPSANSPSKRSKTSEHSESSRSRPQHSGASTPSLVEALKTPGTSENYAAVAAASPKHADGGATTSGVQRGRESQPGKRNEGEDTGGERGGEQGEGEWRGKGENGGGQGKGKGKGKGRGEENGGSVAGEEGADEREGTEDGEGSSERFVLARLQGTLVGDPRDGVERRFTSFFSRVALQLDSEAFPDVTAVEVRGGVSVFFSGRKVLLKTAFGFLFFV